MKFLLLVLMFIANVAFAGDHGGGGSGGGGNYLKLDPFVVNLTGNNTYISFSAQLKADPADLDILKGYMPRIRHTLIKKMIGTRSEKAETPKFMQEFADEAVEFINKAIGRELVQDVYFTDWILQ
jgi:flagellar basal body-associated protein FliL